VNALVKLLPDFLQTRRWYGGKARTLRDVDVLDVIPLPEAEAYIVLVQTEYTEGDSDIYLLPVAVARGAAAADVEAQFADTIVARLQARDGSVGLLYGAIWQHTFRDALLGIIARRRRLRGRAGEIVGSHSRELRRIWGESHPNLESTVARAEQSNTSVLFGDRFILKLFRKVEFGVNPDVELGRYLSETGFRGTPRFGGHIEYRRHDGEAMEVAILQEFVKNEGDAWKYTLDSLSQFFENALARPEPAALPVGVDAHPMSLMQLDLPTLPREMMGTYLESARLLGIRTAEMHLAFSKAQGPEFTPEPFTDHYQQGLYHGFVAQANRSLRLLRTQVPKLGDAAARMASMVLDAENDINTRFKALRTRRIHGLRIRHHGDYHLGQVLYTGKDFSIIDFEGEPARPLGERRLKRSALRDVAGMLRSFQYVSYAALYGQVAGVVPRPETSALLEQWASFWYGWTASSFLRGYFKTADNATFLPSNFEELRLLLDVYLMDKALYELGYELNNRPDWVRIPLAGILRLLGR
jgi:maltose alpha-D-glucosyltransferase/alpha-amylase